jgi:MarR family transcriptional regulator, organic hydroperoxide resistance regulator
MLALSEKDGHVVSQIERRLYLDSGTLTLRLKRLEITGCITRIRAHEVEWHVHIKPTDPGRHLNICAVNLPTCILCASQCSVAEMSALTQHIQSMRKQLVGGTPLTLSSTTPIA